MTLYRKLFGLSLSRKKVVRERAAAGARRLDVVLPGWYGRVDTNTLDQGDYELCVLGQCFGEEVDARWVNGFLKGLDTVGWEHGTEYGFCCHDAWEEEIDLNYAVLNKAFKKEIANRKAAQ